MRWIKILLFVVLLAAEGALLASMPDATNVRDQEAQKAWIAYLKNPNPQTKAASDAGWQRSYAAFEKKENVFNCLLVVNLFALVSTGYWAFSKRARLF